MHDLSSFNTRTQVSTAQKMWTSVRCPQMPAKMVALVTIQWAASTAFAWTAGRVMTAARTSMTALVQLATKEPHVMTVLHHSSVNAHTGALVSARRGYVWLRTENEAANTMYSPVNFLFCSSFSYYFQVCCVIWMMRASVTHVRKVPTVTPTLLMAWPSAPAPLATLAQPATRTLTSAPLVIGNHCTA